MQESILDKLRNLDKPKEPQASTLDTLRGLKLPGDERVSSYSPVLSDLPENQNVSIDPNMSLSLEDITQSEIRSAWNSFKTGMDETQNSTYEGKLDEFQREIDSNSLKKDELLDHFKNGRISQYELDSQINALQQNDALAKKEIEGYDEDIKSNEADIRDNYVSKLYKMKEATVQAKGGDSGLWESIKYTTPSVAGSSASLMGQQLAVTFGTGMAKNVAKAAAAGAIGGPVGDFIAVTGTILTAIGTLAYARDAETMAEVGGQLKSTREELEYKWRTENPGLEPDEKTLRDIRIQSRKGIDELYDQQMMLVIPDAVESLLFPGSKVLGAFKGGRALEQTFKGVTGATKATRAATLGGKLYATYIGEKFEEGYQYATGKRQTSEALGLAEYEDKGFISNVLTDSFDTLESISYGPGGTLRGDGKYSDDKEFQFAESSGGLLAILPGGVMAGAKLYKDVSTFRETNRELQKSGIANPEDKWFRLKDQIYQKHFNNNTIEYLLEGIQNLGKQTNEKGLPFLTKEEVASETKNVKDAFDKYLEVERHVEDILPDGKFNFLKTKEQKQKIADLKKDLFHSAIQLTRHQSEIKTVESMNNINNLIEQQEELVDKIKNTTDNSTIRKTYNIDSRLKIAENKLSSLKKTRDAILKDSGLTEKELPGVSSIEESNRNREYLIGELNLTETSNAYKELLKVKDAKTLDEWHASRKKDISEKKEGIDEAIKTTIKPEPSDEEQDEEESIGFSDNTGQQAFNQPTIYSKDTDAKLSERLEQLKNPIDAEGEYHLAEVEREIAKRKTSKAASAETPENKNKVRAINTFAKNAYESIKSGNEFKPEGTDLDFYNEFKADIDKELEIIKELDQIINYDITETEVPGENKLTPGQKQDKMIKVISLMGLDPKTFTFQQVYNKAVEIFGKEGAAVGFNALNSAVYSIQIENKNDNRTKTASAKLDENNLLVIDGAVKPSENTGNTTTVIASEVKGLQRSLAQRVRENDPTIIITPGGKLLDDVLAVANNQVEFETTTDTQGFTKTEDKYDSTGKLVFNPKQDQIVGTSEIKIGSTLTFKVENPNDIKDKGSHPIAIYFGEHKIGYVHNTDYVGPNTMAPVNYKSQIEKIKSLRELLLKSPNKTFQTTITEKGFGVANISEQSIPIASIMENDPSIQIAFKKSGQLQGHTITEDVQTFEGLAEGSVVLLVKHPNGYFFPIYTSQTKLGEASTTEANSPKNEVLRAINGFLSGKLTVKQAGMIAERWVRTGDAFFKFVYNEGGSYVNIGGTKYNTESSKEDLENIVDNLYFNLNGNILNNKDERESYVADIKNFGLLRTNLQANPVKLDNGTTEQSYFSQVTIKYAVPGGIILDGIKEDVSDKKADIEKRRQEELDENTENIVVKSEIYDGLDHEDNPITYRIETMLDGSRIISLKTTQGNKTYFTPMERVGKGNTIGNREFLNMSFGVQKVKLISTENNPTSKYKDKINAKYDAELAALESKKPQVNQEEVDAKLKDLGFEFDEDSEENNDINYDLTEEQIESIKSNTSSVIISPKINPSIQEELKLSFAYRLLTSEKSDGTTNKGLLKSYIEDSLAALKAKDNSKNLPKKKQFDRVIEIYEEVLNEKNFDKFFDASDLFLKSLGLNELADGFYEQIEEKEESINQMIDGSASFEDRADNASAEFKKFLFFLPAMYYKKDGTIANRTNSLGQVTFNNYTETFKLIAQELSQYTYKNDMSSLQLMIDKLAVHPNPVVQEVAKRLKTDSVPFKIKRQFYTIFNQQHATFKTLLFRERKSKTTGGEHKTTFLKSLFASFVNSDRSKAQKALAKEWIEVFKLKGKELGLLKTAKDHVTGQDKLSINTTKGKALKARLEDFINDTLNFEKEKSFSGFKYTINPNSLGKLKDILADTGIDISEEGLSSFMAKNHIKGGSYNAMEVLRTHLLNTIYKRISGDLKSKEDDSIWVLNNHFEKEEKTIDLLARAEYPFRTNLFSASFRDNGKSYYSFIRHNPLSRLFQKLTTYENGKNEFITNKRQHDAFASQSLVLEELENENTTFKFLPSILLNFKNSSNKGSKSKEITDSTTKEHEFVKATLFFNNGNNTSVFMRDTDSDKSTKITQEMTKMFIDGFKGSINDETIAISDKNKKILRRYFTAELKRINLVNKQIVEFKDQPNKLIAEYHLTKDGKPGQGSLFNLYSFLNKEVLEKTNPRLAELLYVDGKLISEESVNSEIQGLVDQEVEQNMNKLFKAKKEDWMKLGLWKTELSANKKYSRFNINNLIDNKYLKSVSNKIGLSDATLKLVEKGVHVWDSQELDNAYEKILDYAVVDFVLNYAVYSNEMLMLTGDPALQGKGKGSVMERVRSTFDNIGKRNARLLASGNSGLFQKGTYNIAFAEDMKIDSKHTEEYVDLLKGLFDRKSIEKSFNDGDETDAQELTTVEEKLDVMLAFGEINEPEHKHLLGLYDKAAYKKKFNEDAPIYSQEDRLNSLELVLQPDKPVQVADKLDEELNLTRQYYIKTSSFPLLPDLIQGTELGKILDSMKKNDVQRLVFRTGVKIGLPVESKSIYKDGLANTDFFTNNKTTLSREHFTIQLKVPFKEDKKAVKEGTQMMKLLFMDLPYNLMTSLGLVKDIQKDYVDIHKRIVQLEKEKLYKEIGARNTEDGLVIDNLKALSDLLIKEGKDRGYDISSLLGLEIDPQTNQFKTPLTFLTNSAQIEPVITALITNRLSKTMMPGRSYVQGSEVLFRRRQIVDLENYKDKRGIIWTKPEYANMDKLGFVSVKDKKIAQIILPSYFQDKDGNLIDMKQFVVNGKMDMSKIDKDLLEINGFRIPTAGHNSMMWFEVVGFLPYGVGDLAIVPSEIVAQMGSDFDVDKLFSYFFNYTFNDGQLRKIPSNKNGNKKEMQNAMMDIHKAVLTNDAVIPMLIEPTSTEHLSNVIDKTAGLEEEWLGSYDTNYQRRTFFDNMGGQLGTGITANINTLHVSAQQANLYLKTQGVLFKNKEGQYFADDATQNRVNEYKPSLYGKKENDNSAWRLDKIKSFSGRRISSIIAEWLSASVDNAKDKLLGKGGINEHNFNVGLLIAMTGFDNKWIIPFINQPILKRYYSKLDLVEDSIETSYESNRKGLALEELVNEFKEEFGISDEEISALPEGFTQQEYKDMLVTPLNKETAIMQISILNEFIRYKAIADDLRTVQSALRVSSNGVGASMVQMQENASKAEKLQSDKEFIGNTDRLETETVEAAFIDIPKIGMQLFGKFYAYSSNAYQNVVERLSVLMGKPDLFEQDFNDIYNGIQEFSYTNPKLGLYTDITETRKELLFNSEEKKSLAGRLLDLQEKYTADKFVQILTPSTSEDSNSPEYIFMGNTSNQGKEFQSEIALQWISNIISYPEGHEMRVFFEDLTKYAMLVNSSQFGASNLLKYIPYQYLEQIKFGQTLNEMNLEDESFLNNFTEQFLQHNPNLTKFTKEENVENIERNQIEVEGKLIAGNKILSFTVPAIDSEKNKAFNLVQQIKLPGGTTLNKYRDYVSIYDTEAKSRILFKKSEEGGITKYTRLDKLGDSNSNEYDWNKKSNNTLIESQKADIAMEAKEASVLPTEPLNDTSNQNFEEVFRESNDIQSLLGNVLIRSQSSRNNSDMKVVYGELAYQLSQVEGTEEINLTFNGEASYFREDGKILTINIGSLSFGSEDNTIRTILHEAVHSTTQVKLNDKEFQKTEEYKQAKAVHDKYIEHVKSEGDKTIIFDKTEGELTYALFNTYAELFRGFRYKNSNGGAIDKFNGYDSLINSINGEKQESPLVNADNGVYTTTPLKALLNHLGLPITTELTDSQKKFLVDLLTKESGIQDNFTENKAKYYPAFSIHEFFSETMTNKRTQEILKSIKVDKNKVKSPSLWDSFIQAIIKLHNLVSSEPTLLTDAVNSIVAVIEYQKTNEEIFKGLKTGGLNADYLYKFQTNSKGEVLSGEYKTTTKDWQPITSKSELKSKYSKLKNLDEYEKKKPDNPISDDIVSLEIPLNQENLGMSIGDFLKTLSKEQRAEYYKLIDNKLLDKVCK